MPSNLITESSLKTNAKLPNVNVARLSAKLSNQDIIDLQTPEILNEKA